VSPSQVERVAQQAGKAAPAVAIAGALVAAPQAAHVIAASARPAVVTVQDHQAPATRTTAGTGASTGEPTGTATLDAVETRSVTVAATSTARHAAKATYYRVRSGDSLSGIAGRFYHHADDWQYLYHENEKTISNPNLIYVGERLFIPATVPASYKPAGYVPRHAAKSAVTASKTSHGSGSGTPGGRADGGAVVVQSAAQGSYSCSALEGLWDQAGGATSAARMAAEIAMAESGGNPNAISPTDDFGLWQINASHGSLATLNPYQNARSAITLSDDGNNWNPWTTYRTDAYYSRC
jgi:LysM repeat protein